MPKSTNRTTLILFCVVIVALSAAAFFGFTLKKATQRRQADALEQQRAVQRAAEAQETQDAERAETRRRELLVTLIEKAAAGDTPAVEHYFAAGEHPDHPLRMAMLLDRIFGDLDYQPVLDAAHLAPPPAAHFYIVPLVRASDGELKHHELGIQFLPSIDGPPFLATLMLPSDLQAELRDTPPAMPAATANATAPKASVATIAPAEVDTTAPSAAEIIASRFVDAIIRLDYKTARAQCIADKLPAEKVAALCFVFEDSRVPDTTDPRITVTAATDRTAWAITRIHAPAWDEHLEFGMEIEQRNLPSLQPDSPENWGIAAINLSDVLERYASRTAAEEIPYAPIVGNPNGGESLVLYFPYDSDEIHQRARKQLEIVAALLEGDAERKIRITGHADALGTLGYNEALSSERAVEVRSFLIGAGIPAAQIVTEAAGELLPLAPNQRADGTDNPEGRARNRRAEIYLDF